MKITYKFYPRSAREDDRVDILVEAAPTEVMLQLRWGKRKLAMELSESRPKPLEGEVKEFVAAMDVRTIVTVEVHSKGLPVRHSRAWVPRQFYPRSKVHLEVYEA